MIEFFYHRKHLQLTFSFQHVFTSQMGKPSDRSIGQNVAMQSKASPVGSIASQRPLSQLSSHNVIKYNQNYGAENNAPAVHPQFQKPIESSQSMHNLSKSGMSAAMPSPSDQNQSMKTAASSGNLAVATSSANKQSADQRLTHEQFRAALQMVVRTYFSLILG